MANITAMPFRSVNADRPVSASMDARRFAQYVTNGIDNVSGENALKVSASDSEFALLVAPGGAVINGYSGWLEEAATLPLSTPDNTYSRIDRVVFRLNLNLDVRFFELVIITGAPSENPTVPEITRNDLIYDLVLADVTIAAGSVAINSDSITDLRDDANLCGRSGTIIAPEYTPKATYEGNGAPTKTTPGNLGDVYIDTSENPCGYYVCLSVGDGVYAWERMGYMAKKLVTEIITASTTWVVPETAKKLNQFRIMVFGGGGSSRSTGYGYGGGGGGYMATYTGNLDEDSYIVTIGSGGETSANGATGGATSFGELVSASGGGKGVLTNGGDGGTGGGGGYGSSNGGTGGNGAYGGGGGGCGASGNDAADGCAGGNGGTYGGGGGGGGSYGTSQHHGKGGDSANYSGGSEGLAGGGSGGAGYSGNGGTYSGAIAGSGGIGEDTTDNEDVEFPGLGTAGAGGSNNYGGGGGGGGYGGNGGNGGNGSGGSGTGSSSYYGGGGGGGGGYGGNGGNGGTGKSSTYGGAGGGGGGYGGNGGSASDRYGGGGGGYGKANYGSGGDGGGYSGKDGVCIIQYQIYAVE